MSKVYNKFLTRTYIYIISLFSHLFHLRDDGVSHHSNEEEPKNEMRNIEHMGSNLMLN